jgi:hypothetical protein
MAFVDGTSNLTQNGAIQWKSSAMTNWNKYNLTGETGYELYWVRIRHTANVTTAPIATNFDRNGNKRFAAFAGAFDFNPSMYLNSNSQVSVGGTAISSNNLLQIGTKLNGGGISVLSTTSEVEIDSDGTYTESIFRVSSAVAATAANMIMARSGGTLATPANMATNDILGSFSFKGYVNSAWIDLGGIQGKYLGSGTTGLSDLIFKTATSTGNVTEKMRIQNDGKVGVGTDAPLELLSVGKTGTTGGVISLAGSGTGKAIIQVGATAGTPTLTLGTTTGVVAVVSEIPTKAAGTDIDTGTNDTLFVTSKAINDSHNVPDVAPGTAGNVLTSDGTDWTSASQYTSVTTLAAPVSTAADTVPVDLTGLVWTYAANSKYVFKWIGTVQSANAGTGNGFQLNVSSAVTTISMGFYQQLANTGSLTGGSSVADDASLGVTSAKPTAATSVPIIGHGLLITGANTGTAQLRYKSEVNAVTTADAGMTLVVEKIA